MIGKALDKVIAAISPQLGFRRMAYRQAMRRYAGAEPNRLNANRTPKNQPANQELRGPFGADALRAWARELVRDNSYAWGVVDTIVSSVVGTGIHPLSVLETSDGEDVELVNDVRDARFAEWCEVCDVNGQYSFYEMQIAIQREIVEAGEVLVRKLKLPSTQYKGIYRSVPFALELIEADRLASEADAYLVGSRVGVDNTIVRGIEYTPEGKPVAYYVYKQHPGEQHLIQRTPERIDASEVLHLFRRDRIGQARGVTWFAPAIQWIRDLGTYVDNEMQASAVASCFTVAIKSSRPIGSLAAPEGESATDEGGRAYQYLEPGLVMHLAPDESMEFANPGRPNSGAEPWIQLILRGIAVGTGLSYEVVARDYSQTSYSSSRTSQLEDRRRFRMWQKYLVNNFCQPIWDSFCDAAALAGDAAFPKSEQLLDYRRKVAPVEWQTPDWEWVDPSVEQQTAQNSINSYMSTYADELGAIGKSWRQVMYQRAKEDRLRFKLGLITAEERQQQISAAQTVAANPEPSSTSVEAAPADIAASAFNGAQVTSLVDILTQVGTGAIPKTSSKAILAAAFPMLSQAIIDAIIDPINPGTIAADGVPVGTAIDPAMEGGTGEMAGMSRLQWQRNRKAIEDVLNGVISGEMSPVKATALLSTLGLAQATIDALLSDVSDGTLDTNMEEAPA
jgi:lambda family phage portal protein